MPRGAGRNFVFVGEAVTGNGAGAADHVENHRRYDKPGCRLDEIEKSRQRSRAKAHHPETYCQRSNHRSTLPQDRIQHEENGRDRGAAEESHRGHPLDSLG